MSPHYAGGLCLSPTAAGVLRFVNGSSRERREKLYSLDELE